LIFVFTGAFGNPGTMQNPAYYPEKLRIRPNAEGFKVLVKG